MIIASLSIVAALAFVLGLGALSLWALKRFGGGSLVTRSRIPLEVVQRIALGPKNGLAVVRVGEKVMAISLGEGGIRPLFELDESDRQRVLESSAVPTPMLSSPDAAAAIAKLLPRSFAKWSASSHADRSVRTPVAPAAAPALRTTDDFQAMLGMSLRNTTRLAAFVGLMIVGASTSASPAGAQSTTADTTTRPARAARVGNGAALTRDGVRSTRPMSAVSIDTNRARPTANGRAVAAPPAAVGADDAIMRMMPQMDVKVGNEKDGGLRLNGTVGIVVMMGLLTLLPTLILMMTGFTRILIVLHFLKQAMGTQGAPPAHLLAGMALLLTGFVMAPTLTRVNREAITPWMDGTMTQVEMLKTGVVPMREFMLRQTREADLKTFIELSRMPRPDTVDDVPLHVLMSAFVASELRTAFQIGFAIYLPFIIIDAVVASVLMSMGMFMLPPAMISLPFKLLLFVLVDGWGLTIQSLVQSFK